tara:strand:+ start:786 stop:1685 length:900 start_codon:yes stop_codon:yes gene_type:complete
MPRVLDKDTRLIDVDFGPVGVTVSRPTGEFAPLNPATLSLNGTNQVISNQGIGIAGSFCQYVRLDLDYMTMNNEVYQPVDVSVQRTSPVPLGSHINGNNFDQIEEFIFVFSRPLRNQNLDGTTDLGQVEATIRRLGLNRSQDTTGSRTLGGVDAGLPTQDQTIYAEKRMYSYTNNLAASVSNGELGPAGGGVPFPEYNTLQSMPILDSVTTWGSMSAITGPTLHCYRFVFMRVQNFPALRAGGLPIFTNVNALADGATQLEFPPVNVTFLARDAKLTEGEYLTTLANAMNSIPEDGPTA